MIAFLGMGLLGSNFVRALRRRGEVVQVWNRAPGKARAVADETGASAFDDVADAVRGASRIHLTLSDDASVDAVLAAAESRIAPGTTIVDHTTTAPTPTAARLAYWTERGVHFLHAPVMMGPGNALDASGTMLVSGDRALVDTLTPVLAPMTGKLVYLGPEPMRATSMKLMANLFLIGLTGGLADMFALGDALGVPDTEAHQIFDWFNMATMVQGRAKRMRGADLSQPSWMLTMARKDARLMIESAEEHGGQLMAIPAIAAAMDRLIAAGRGNDDWMIIGGAPPQ